MNFQNLSLLSFFKIREIIFSNFGALISKSQNYFFKNFRLITKSENDQNLGLCEMESETYTDDYKKIYSIVGGGVKPVLSRKERR